MARIPIIDENDPATTADQKAVLADAGAARGKVLNIHRVMANRPEALRAFMQLVHTVYRGGSSLQPRHGEFAYLTATAVNNCYY